MTTYPITEAIPKTAPNKPPYIGLLWRGIESVMMMIAPDLIEMSDDTQIDEL